MICARCDQPIQPDETPLPVVHHSASAGGSTVYVHPYLCERPRGSQQTYQRPVVRHRSRRRG